MTLRPEHHRGSYCLVACLWALATSAQASTCDDYAAYMGWVGSTGTVQYDDFDIAGERLFAVSESQLTLFDISDPFRPQVLGEVGIDARRGDFRRGSLGGYAGAGVVVSGNFAYTRQALSSRRLRGKRRAEPGLRPGRARC